MVTALTAVFYMCNVKVTLLCTKLVWQDFNVEQLDIPQTFTCEETKNIAFLKVHKAASTTLMNIFQRFGETRNLIFALAKKGNYIHYDSDSYFYDLVPPPGNRNYNILLNHVVYNRLAFERVMPRHTIYIAIVRKPLDRLVSSVEYYSKVYPKRYLLRIPGENKVSEFLKDPERYEPTPGHKTHTNNRMALDMGLPIKSVRDHQAIMSYIEKLDRELDLVLIMEYMDESLVLMRRMLCWHLKDILYVARNVNSHKVEYNFNKQDIINHQTWEMADVLVYDHFYEKLWENIALQESEFHNEVKVFKEKNQIVRSYCLAATTSNSGSPLKPLIVDATPFNDVFRVTPDDCHLMTSSEFAFLERSRRRQFEIKP